MADFWEFAKAYIPTSDTSYYQCSTPRIDEKYGDIVIEMVSSSEELTSLDESEENLPKWYVEGKKEGKYS